MLILESATLRLMPAAKLIGRDPGVRVGEVLLVQPCRVAIMHLGKIAGGEREKSGSD